MDSFAAYRRRTAGRDHHGFVATARDDGRLVGVVNINNVVLRSFRSGYMGYYAFTGAEGRGLMAEAVGLVATHAFDELGLHRLEANIQPGNVASSALVRRLGFRLEGFSPDYLFIDGAWRDHERWALLADEFVGRRSADAGG
ncbi:MAG: GNAT family protein [Actinomycetota bacterium]